MAADAVDRFEARIADHADHAGDRVEPPAGLPVLAEVERSGVVESRHRGSVVAIDSPGSVTWARGDVTKPIFPRSCNKPIQAVAMLRAGLDLDGESLALATASHSGEAFHLDGVRRILDRAGLVEDDLQNPPDWPLDHDAMLEHVRTAGEPARLAMNCSGKHAAMLATCAAHGWPTATYRRADHPLQVRIRETLEELAGETVAATGVDGCGAPLFAVSLTGLARAFRALAVAPEGTPEWRVAEAIRTYPERVSGTRRDEATLIRGVPGLLAKAGAEGCYAAALPDGRAAALKIEDGGSRARPVVMAAALRRLCIDEDVLGEIGQATVLGGSDPVGTVRPAPTY